MLKASYYAGAAFTRAYVGYVHAIAHTFGGFYQVPHGYANAVVLPHVLTHYGKHVVKPLSKLALQNDLCNASMTSEVCAQRFIEAIQQLNKAMNIPTTIDKIQSKDIPNMVEKAMSEGNPLYPVPKIWKQKDFERIYYKLQEKNTI